jgi:hypothetical protein
MEISRFVISEMLPPNDKLAAEYFLLSQVTQALNDTAGLTTAFSTCCIQFTPRLIEHALLANTMLFGSDTRVLLFPAGDLATGDACLDHSIPNYHRGRVTLLMFATKKAHLSEISGGV